MSGIQGQKVSCYNVNIIEQLRRDKARKANLRAKLATLERSSIEHEQVQAQIDYINRRLVRWLHGRCITSLL